MSNAGRIRLNPCGTAAVNWLLMAVCSAVMLLPVRAPGKETVVWRLGTPDRSDHEFNGSTPPPTNGVFWVNVNAADQSRRWPHFHPGNGNGACGGRLYRYGLVFDLPGGAPEGTFYLDVSLLFRQPRVPALELDLNGHHGRFYFDPDPMFELSALQDEFNPIRAAARRRIALPASFFKPGENRLVLSAVDLPPVVVTNQNVGGTGDSGFFYDSLALTQDPQIAPSSEISASLIPTGLFPRTKQGVKEQVFLDVRFPADWPGGRARLKLETFTAELAIPKSAEFGECRYPVLLPPDLPSGTAQIELTGSNGAPVRICSVEFKPARKWKVFYAPNEHLDIGYTDFRAKVAEVHARCLDELMEVLKQHPRYRFNIDGSWVNEQWLDLRTPAWTAQLRAHARSGQIGVNAFYCSAATEYPSLEENLRNLYFSKDLERRFSVPFDFALVSDVPSVSWSLPSVLAAAGIRYFANGGNQDRGPMLVNGHWNARSPFWWEGPDGQRVLSWFSAHYHQFKAVFGSPPSLDSGQGGLTRFLRAYERPDYAPDAVLLYGTEVENLPTDYPDAAFVERWNERFAWPQLIPCRFADYFRYVEKHYGAALPVVRGTGGAYWADNYGMLAAATGRDRANQTRVIAAETLATLTAALDPKLRFTRDLDQDIWRNLLGYADHNFGTGRTSSQPESDEVVGVVREKEEFTVRAGQDIDKLMRYSMSRLADQVKTDGRNLVVFNPLAWKRSGLVEWQVDDGTVLTNAVSGEVVPCELLTEKDGAQTIRFEAADLPPLGYRVYRLGHGLMRQPTASTLSDNTVENRFYRLTFDPTRAAIKSLYDKELGRELVDPRSPYLLNEYLFASGGGSETGRGRGAEDSQLLHPFLWLPPAELTVRGAENGKLLGVERTAWGWRIRLAATARHTPEIETEIQLPDDRKQIDIANCIRVDLLYAKQASYFAFPWALTNRTFRYDIGNGFVDPARDLLTGGCSDWFAIQNLVNVADDRTAVSVAAAEAPLVCLGDINRGRWSPQFTNQCATMFSYVLNNYWSPKWAGKKQAQLIYHYSLTSGAQFEPASAVRWAAELRSPLEIAALKSSDKLPGFRGQLPPGEGSFGSVEPANLVLTALKPAEDGRGLVARVLETAGRQTDGLLRLSFLDVASAHQANAVEICGAALKTDRAGVHFHVKPHQILTLRLISKPARG